MANTVRNLNVATALLMNGATVPGEPVFYGTAPSSKDDFILLQRIGQGDQAAMAEIFDRHGKAVYSVARHVLKDDAHAEDAVQEIFFKVWQNPESFISTRGSLRTWLLVVAKHLSIDLLRRKRHTEPVEEERLGSPGNQFLAAEHNILIEKVQRALKNLPEEQRQSVQLAFFEDLTHAEIAERTGEPLGTVKTRIRTALIRLRKALATC